MAEMIQVLKSRETNASAHIVAGPTGGQEKREEACTQILLDSGTWRPAATRLRIDSASSRSVEPFGHASVSREQGNRVTDGEFVGDLFHYLEWYKR